MKIIFLIGLFLLSSVWAKPLEVSVSAPSAILINAKTGQVLFEKNATDVLFPASITKVATALFLLEGKKIDWHQMAHVSGDCISYKPATGEHPNLPAYWLEFDGSKMGLRRDEIISTESLLHGLLLRSGNDAANVLAEMASGSVGNFMNELNCFLSSIGCKNTHFMNPHGLHHPDHVTTAHDMALIARLAMRNAGFASIVCKQNYTKPPTNKQNEEELRQSNRLLCPGKHYYSKAIGIKTGYTSHAQNNLVAAAEQEGRTLIAVLMGCNKSDDRYCDAKRLFEAAFSETKVRRIALTGFETYSHIVPGAIRPCEGIIAHPLAIDYFPSEEPENMQAQVFWLDAIQHAKKGKKVGSVRLINAHGELLQETDLIAKRDVELTWVYTIKEWVKSWF